MRFSQPVHRVTSGGDILFSDSMAMSIMRNSSNHDLAWEFLRFCMEITGETPDEEDENIFVPAAMDFNRLGGIPVNRARFDIWAYEMIMFWGYEMPNMAGERWIFLDVPVEEAVSEAVVFYREMMEMFTRERRSNYAVFNSLIYPDLYMFVHGRQDVDTTLANIQSRLELFVHE
jgi:hypothetical protein